VLGRNEGARALLFFIAILPQLIEPSGSVGRQIASPGASSVAIELVVLALYATLEGLAGALLVFAGAGLAALRA
jgi:threonine/homoserine/homoserine lactone efflux protein